MGAVRDIIGCKTQNFDEHGMERAPLTSWASPVTLYQVLRKKVQWREHFVGLSIMQTNAKKKCILQRGGELFHAIIGPLCHLKQVSAFFDHVLEAHGIYWRILWIDDLTYLFIDKRHNNRIYSLNFILTHKLTRTPHGPTPGLLWRPWPWNGFER